MGLGFSESKEIDLGLGTPYTVVVVIIVPEEEPAPRQGSPGGAGRYAGHVDYGYREAAQRAEIQRRIMQDDNEVFEIIIITLQSGLI